MKRPEEALQRQVVSYLRVALPPAVVWWHTPSQKGTRTRAEMGVLKALGVRPGVPDLTFVLPGGKAAFIELKAPKGKPTDNQTTFAEAVTQAGADYALCRSLEEVSKALVTWGCNLRARAA